MKTTLLIMAAGIGSRFGEGIKQLAPVGMNDEIIMDYSIHDAIKAGFNKIVIVIRKDIEDDFNERIGNRISAFCKEKGIELSYAFQDMKDIPEGFSVPGGRTKPWGTGQAVLAARDIIKEPFMVINADDYYGKEAFIKLNEYLSKEHADNEYCMAGFYLKNTLSDNGGVTRGLCKVDDKYLTDIVETSDIIKTAEGASSNGVAIDVESYASMNMWGFPAKQGEKPGYIKILEEDFVKFFERSVPSNPEKAEYLLPNHIGALLKEGKISVEVLDTNDKWFGVTYKEDKPLVVENFKKMIEDGIYNKDLYADI